jgi:hypothetical protein
LDVPLRVIASPTFFNYRVDQMQHGIQAHALYPKALSARRAPDAVGPRHGFAAAQLWTTCLRSKS